MGQESAGNTNIEQSLYAALVIKVQFLIIHPIQFKAQFSDKN